MKNNPLVSVLIPTYNRENTIRKALDSDDYISNDFIETLIDVFNDEDIGFGYSGVKWFNVDDGSVKNSIGYNLGDSKFYSTEYYLKRLTIKGDVPISASCAIFKRDIMEYLFKNEINFHYFKKEIYNTGAGFDSLMFLYACKMYKKFYFDSSAISYFGMSNTSISIEKGEKLYPLYFYILANYLQEEKKYYLLKNIKSKIIFFKTHLINNLKIKDELNLIYNNIVIDRSQYMYFYFLIKYQQKRILDYIIRKIS